MYTYLYQKILLNLSMISDRKQYRTQGDFSDTEGVLAKVLATMS